MAINDFEFPGVELHQEFVETPVTGVSQLGVVVVGYQYKLAPYDDVVYDSTSSKELSIFDLPGYTEDEYIDKTAGAPHSIVVRDGLFLNYTAPSTGTADINIVSGSTVDTASNSATVKFDELIQGGTAAEAAFGTLPPQVGDSVDLFIAGSTTGVSSVITAISGRTIKAEPAKSSIELSAGTVTTVAFYTVTQGEIADVDTSMTLPANATAKIAGKDSAAALQSGTYDLLLKYRDAGNSAVTSLGAVGSLTEIRAAFGAITSENPMAVALAFALQAASGNIVYYKSIKGGDSKDNFDDAMDFLAKYDVVYSVVPVFQASTTAATKVNIIKSLISAAEAAERDVESKIRRSIWYGLFEDATNLSGTPSLVEQLKNARTRIGASYRAQAVWADDPMYNGEIIDTSAIASAAAGMRCYEPTYRPISNLGYNFFSVKDTNGLTKTQLLDLGANGIWLVDNNYDGTPINLRQITTAVSNNLNRDEESIVANADSIALTLCRVGENLVGCSNISPDLLVALHDTLTGIMDAYTVNHTGNVYVGPQLLSWSLDALYQDPIRLDHIYATITCEPPRPFNRFVLTLRVV